MSRINREIATFASPLHGALAPRPLAGPWLPRAWRELVAALEHAVDVAWTWHERTKTRRQLAMMDDHLLKDIGISRPQAWSEADKPFWRA
jgi:uncharacterized protein YjiS (DUF1127 family)